MPPPAATDAAGDPAVAEADRPLPTSSLLLGDEGAVIPGKDRRKHARIACIVKVHLLEVSEYGYVAASPNICDSCDLSIGGVGVISRRPYNPGDRLIIVIAPESKKSRKLRFGIVRQSRYSGGARYHVGLQFVEAFEGKNITRWLSQNWVE